MSTWRNKASVLKRSAANFVSLSWCNTDFRVRRNFFYVYCFNYFFLLVLGNARYWDDWKYVGDVEFFRESVRVGGGQPWRTWFEFDLLDGNPIVFRLLTFTCFFLAALSVRRILLLGTTMSMVQINLIVLLFMIFPGNSARYSMITLNYAICYALFFIAWAILLMPSYWRLFAVPIFLVSFNTISLVAFFVLPLAHAFLIAAKTKSRQAAATQGTALLLLPIFYLLLRYFTFGADLSEYMTPRYSGTIRATLFTIALTIPLLNATRRAIVMKQTTSSSTLPLVEIGLAIVAIGAFPYMAGGHLVDISDWLIAFVPNYSDWDSRHQLLLPLGFSLILIGLFGPKNLSDFSGMKRFVLIGLVLIASVLNFTFGQEYYLDALKQREILQVVGNLGIPEDSSGIMIHDTALRFNARGRVVRSYEYNGMFSSVDPRLKDLIIEPLRFADCVEFAPDKLLTIDAQAGRLRALLTRNVGLTIQVRDIEPC